jgi:hypothetical protein
VKLGELLPGAAYRYAVVATNALGTTIGPERTFTTALGASAPPPGEAVNPTPGPSLFPAATLSAVLPYTTFAQIEAKEPKASIRDSTPKTLTKKQLLAKALKACHRDKTKTKRAACESHARKQYDKAKKR